MKIWRAVWGQETVIFNWHVSELTPQDGDSKTADAGNPDADSSDAQITGEVHGCHWLLSVASGNDSILTVITTA